MRYALRHAGLRIAISPMLAAVLLAVVVGSCSSPADVPANRRETRDGEEGSRNLDSAIYVSPDAIDLGTYPDNSIANAGVTSFIDVIATRDAVGSVISARLATGKRGFEILGPATFAMTSKGADSASFRVPVRFRSPGRGRYLDTLILGDTFRIPLKAIVGDYLIYVTDAEFDSINVGSLTAADIDIVNNSDRVASIHSMAVKATLGNGIKLLNLVYDDIQPGEKYTLNLEFEPSDAGPHAAEITVGIRDVGPIPVDSVGVAIGRAW